MLSEKKVVNTGCFPLSQIRVFVDNSNNNENITMKFSEDFLGQQFKEK